MINKAVIGNSHGWSHIRTCLRLCFKEDCIAVNITYNYKSSTGCQYLSGRSTRLAQYLLTPGNDRGDASDSISQSNQIGSRSFRSIEHENSSLVDKHERTAYYIGIQINVT